MSTITEELNTTEQVPSPDEKTNEEVSPSSNGDKDVSKESTNDAVTDWKKQYSESSREAMRLAQERNALKAELERLRSQTSVQSDTKPVIVDSSVAEELANVKSRMESLEKQENEKVVENFRASTKIDDDRTLADLTDEEWSEVQTKMGEKMIENGINLNANIPLTQVPKILANTWKLVREDINLAMPDNSASDLGKMKGSPSLGSRPNTVRLTPEEEKVAKNFGMTPAEYAEYRSKSR